ncbi:MAG: hypothetical protein WDN48_05790 [Pseudolabrys sp.]
MTKSKKITAALAALTLATTFTAIGGQAQAHPKFGHGLGFGIAAGTLIGIAAANAYYDAPVYRECRYVDRMDRWGNVRTNKICDVAPY